MTDNGSLSASQRVIVQGAITLAPATAGAYFALKGRARAQRRNLDIWTPAGGYRSRTIQQDMHDHPERYNIRPGIKLADVGKSTHGQGRAVDLLGPRDWVRANAPDFGFRQRDPVGDPDCWVHGDYLQTESTTTAGDTGAVIDPTPKDSEMITRRLVRQADQARVYLQVNMELAPMRSPEHLAFVQADLRGLAAAGDAFLNQVGPTLADVQVVRDISWYGIVPQLESERGHAFTPDELAAIGSRIPLPPADVDALADALEDRGILTRTELLDVLGSVRLSVA